MPRLPAVRGLAARATRNPAFDWFVRRMESVGTWPANSVAVLTYHRVDDPGAEPDLYPGLISATPADFEVQIAHLAARMSPIGADDLLAARRGQRRLPRNAVVVTFDDAYSDFGVRAWPILRRHGVPVVLFVPTGFPDQPGRAFWWDRVHTALLRAAPERVRIAGLEELDLSGPGSRTAAFLTLRHEVKGMAHGAAMDLVERLLRALDGPPGRNAVLGWDRLRELQAEGVTLAAHSRTHPLLTRLGPADLDDEIAGSLDDLERETGSRMPLLAYPSGAFDVRTVQAADRLGIEIAMTTERGINVPGIEWLRLRRINVGGRTNLAVLRAQLTPTAARVSRPAAGS